MESFNNICFFYGFSIFHLDDINVVHFGGV